MKMNWIKKNWMVIMLVIVVVLLMLYKGKHMEMMTEKMFGKPINFIAENTPMKYIKGFFVGTKYAEVPQKKENSSESTLEGSNERMTKLSA